MIDHTIQTIILSDILIVLSKYAKKEILSSIKDVDPKKIIVKYPGNDHILIPAKTTKVGYDYFLFVGVVKPIKDVYRLIKAYAEFKKKNKRSKIKLVLLGRKEPEYWKSIIRQPEYLEYKDDIVTIEGVDDRQLINYYLNATAIVNTSKVEGLGFPVLEALSLGKKVIVNNVPIYKEFRNKYHNLWISDTDKELVSFMKKAATSKKPVEKVGFFSWEEFCQTILEKAINISPEK
jgi:glycosyltransferase involved in cell wall biosynthesis